MKSNRKRFFLALFFGTSVGTIASLAVNYLFSLVPLIGPPKSWLYVGIQGFFCMLFASWCVLYFGGKWKKAKND